MRHWFVRVVYGTETKGGSSFKHETIIITMNRSVAIYKQKKIKINKIKKNLTLLYGRVKR